MFLKSIILFLYFQVCLSKIKILSYNFTYDNIELEYKINEYELNNSVHFYDIIQTHPSTLLIIFNNIPVKKSNRPKYCINHKHNVINTTKTKKVTTHPTKTSTITPYLSTIKINLYTSDNCS